MGEGYDWDLLKSVDGVNVTDELQLRTDAGMNREHVLVYDSAQRQAIEGLHELVPDRVVAVVIQTLLVEAEPTGNA